MVIDVSRLTNFCIGCLKKAGMPEEEARTTAEALVLTDTWGVFTHGTKNLAGYIRRLKGGGLNPRAKPRVVAEGPAWALVEGDNAIGMVASTFAMSAAMGKAKRAGIGFAGLKGSCHFGAAGVYSRLAARDGMIGVSMTNDTPTVSVPGSRTAVLGSNPISYALPTEPPIMLDIATSSVAGGKVFTAAATNKPIPEGWIIDEQGLPTRDPKLFPEHASLTPFAGHKGYGIALLIEVLSAVITGAAIGSQVPSWSFSPAELHTNHGGSFIAINLEAFLPKPVFEERMAELMRQVTSAPCAAGVDRIYLPGQMEWERRERALREGMELPEEIIGSLSKLGRELGLDFAQCAQK